MIDYEGEQFVTTGQACDLLGRDVTAALVQDWVRRGLLKPVGKVPGRSHLFRHQDVLEVEYRTRAERRGRPRREVDLPSDHRKRRISEQPLAVNPARIKLGVRRCSIVTRLGRDCDALVPIDAPVSACLNHMRDAYLWFLDYLQGPYDPAAGSRSSYDLPPIPNPAPPVQDSDFEGLVYYIRFGERIKIGHTQNLAGRLANLPYDEVLAIEPGPLALEKMRHRQFADERIIREWFAPSDGLMSHIQMLVGHYGRPDPRTGERLPD